MENNIDTKIQKVADRLLALLGFKGEARTAKNGDVLMVRILVDDPAILIGRSGEHLSALQYIIWLLAVKQGLGEDIKLLVDVNDYREKRMESILREIEKAIARVKETAQPETLFPMSSYERKRAHELINAHQDLHGESEGFGRERRIIIRKTG